MSLKGNLETFFLSSILQLLDNDKKTGMLRVVGKTEEVRVFIKDGSIIYALGSKKESRLGYLLRTKGVLSEEQLSKCLLTAKEKNEPLGKILVEKGYVSHDMLRQFLYDQVQGVVFDLFLWEKGEFEYTDGRIDTEGKVLVQISIMKLILEASRRIDEMSILRKQIPSDRHVFRISEKVQDKEEVKLNANEWRILSLVDGQRTVRQVILASGYDEFAVYKVFYSLISSALIEKADLPKEKKRSIAGDYTGIITLYTDILQVIRRSIELELGSNTPNLFDKSKPHLLARQQELFAGYNPNLPSASNLNSISGAMAVFQNASEGRSFLINSFNEFIVNIIEQAQGILGTKITTNMLDEIDDLLGYMDKYQTGSSDRDRILTTVKAILGKAQQQVTQRDKDRQKGGLLNLFKRG